MPPVNVVAVTALPVMLASITPYAPVNTSLTLVPDGINVNLDINYCNFDTICDSLENFSKANLRAFSMSSMARRRMFSPSALV